MTIAKRTCSVDGCENKYLANNLCTMHYTRARRHGSVELPIKIVKHCLVGGCNNKYYGKDLCKLHWERMHKHGRTHTTKVYRGGMSKHPLHNTYMNMLERCNNPKNTNYNTYGATGIKVCERWDGENGFTYFIQDMGDKPIGYTLDRIDASGNYEPNNCRWADNTVQAINRRKRADNKTGHTGVWYHEKSSRYHAYIRLQGKYKRLGCYLKIEDAISARKTAEDTMFKPLLGV